MSESLPPAENNDMGESECDQNNNGTNVDGRKEADAMIGKGPSQELQGDCSEAAPPDQWLKSRIDKIAEEVLKKNNVGTIEVGGEELSIDEYTAEMKAHSERNSGGKTVEGNLNEAKQQTEVTTAVMDEYESQIETLKTEIEVLRATLHDATEREQHYKILVGQLDMADSRAQQKWEGFHNNVVQQWSSHCQGLQRQLAFTSMKLRQMSTAGEQTTTPDDGSDSSLTPSVDNIENGASVPTAPPLTDYSDEQQQMPVMTDGNVPTPGFHPSMMPGMPPQMQVPLGQASSPLPQWPVPDNRVTSPYSSLPPPPPMEFLPDPPFITGKMSSARQLHHFFTNLSIIEKAQQEGRAYPQTDQPFWDHEKDDETTAAHIPRRARAFGTSPGLSADHDDHYNQEQEIESLPDAVGVAKPYMLTPTADPFVPENVDVNVGVN